MSKTYSPKEVAAAVLKRCKDMLSESKLVKSESCEDEAEEKVKEHEKKMHKEKKEMEKCGDMKKSSKLKEFVKKKKKTDLKKMFGRPTTTGEGGSVAPAPAPSTSIADQIGFGKKEEMEKRCWEGYKPVKGKKAYSEGSCEKKSEKVEKCGDMKKEEVAAKKAVGLKPLVSDKVQAPKSDEMPKEPKAATTLKSFMMKRKK